MVMIQTAVCWLLLFLWLKTITFPSGVETATISSTEQRFAIVPQDQTAIIGSKVTLPCRVINKAGTLQWTKDDFALGAERSLTGFFRYTMIGSDEEGDFSLSIDPVQLEDDARYQCQVSTGPKGEPNVRSRFAKLTVLVPPERPRIVQGRILETTEDSEIELECISYGGKPPAEITWIDGLGSVVLQGIRYITEQIPDSKLFIAKSIIKVIPKKEHHNTTFVCQAQNEADRTYQSAKITILVRYAPKVKVSIAGGSSNVIVEGSDAKLICEADANPTEVAYKWYINQQQVVSDTMTELTIYNISRQKHDSIVKCEARNLVGKSEDSQTLDVTYGPKFRQKPYSIEADIGSTIILTCDVDGNPTPDITWKKYNSSRVVGKSSNLTIHVNQDTIGRYYCRAYVVGFKEIEADATVRMKRRPTIVKDNIQFGLPGDNVRLECLAYSVPQAEKTVWYFNGREIGPAHQDYSVLEDRIPEGIKTTLVIRESRQEHYGVYNCSVTNQYGTDVAQIVLKPQRNFPLSIVMIVILGGLVMIIAMIMMVILCHRRNKKSIPDENHHHHIEKQCKESDKSSNISEIKLEIRTGSSASNINYESDCHDTDSIVTRLAVPLAGPVPIDQRYSVNRYSVGEYNESMFSNNKESKNNGFVPYSNYMKDYNNPPPAMITSNVPSVESNANSLLTSPPATLDPRYSAAYGNPYLRSGHHNPSLPLPPSLGQPPPPPPYSSLKNGSVPHLAVAAAAATTAPKTTSSTTPSPSSTTSSQYIIAGKSQQITTKKSSQGTHV